MIILFISLISFRLNLPVWYYLSAFVPALPDKMNKPVSCAKDTNIG